MPKISFEIISFTFFIAFPTALPIYFSPPSRSSTASCSPVDAPEGTAALPKIPFSVMASTSTVGFPLESNICLAWILIIVPVSYTHLTLPTIRSV